MGTSGQDGSIGKHGTALTTTSKLQLTTEPPSFSTTQNEAEGKSYNYRFKEAATSNW